MEFDRKRLVGTWQLVRWFITYEDGQVTEPLGPAAEGLLVYTDDGWMSAALMAVGRPRLSRRNPRDASTAERAAAFDTFFAYTCRWRVVGDAVEHSVTLSHNPALVGTVQVRRIRMRGRQLTLSAEEPVADGMRVHRLQWRPAGPAWPQARRRPRRDTAGSAA
ncbi:MAG TPA: lipocalin-like domain-containing protein [Steroidobacteraceae bacterium]|nr:lipocalin-like domain-containing protein [Steroidobacteraceae bacterium]